MVYLQPQWEVLETDDELVLLECLLVDSFQERERDYIEPSKLSTLQRILMTTDGSVTEILEACVSEQIRAIKLCEALVKSPRYIPLMVLEKGAEFLVRKVLLQGKISRRNFMYCESVISTERIGERFRRALIETKKPIGKIWVEQRVEKFKEILDTSRESAGDLADYFNIQPSDKLLSRTYNVVTNCTPVMMITEKFPDSYFLSR